MMQFRFPVGHGLKNLLLGRRFGLIGQQIYIGYWEQFARIGGLFLMLVILIATLSMHVLILEYGAPARIVLSMIALALPDTFFVLIPFSGIFAALALFHRLRQDNEIIIMQSVGCSTFKIIQPLILSALILALIGWLNSLLIAPLSNQQYHSYKRNFQDQVIEVNLKQERFNHLGKKVMLYAGGIADNNTFQNLLISLDLDNGKTQTVMAKTGKFNNNFREPGFLLYEGRLHEYDSQNRQLREVTFDSYRVQFSDDEVREISYQLRSNERFLPDLLFPESTSVLGLDRYDELVAKGHDRLTTPLYFFLLPLISALMIVHTPYSRETLLIPVLVTTTLSFGLYLTHRMAVNLTAGDLAYLPLIYGNLLVSFVLLFLLIRRRQALGFFEPDRWKSRKTRPGESPQGQDQCRGV